MDFEVDRANLHERRIVDVDPPDLATGQARLRVDAFALTSNNITYAAFGDALNYWGFFPARDAGWGRVPVWGYASVVETTHDDIAEGARVYGYLPMSTHVAVTPGRLDAQGFTDIAPHRAPMAGVYNRYLRVDSDPIHDPVHEDHRMLLWPLFYTSFLIDDFLDDNRLFGAAAVVVSSASSKTAIGTSFQVSRRNSAEVIGLTSAGNVDFVESLGTYDRVVTYGDVASLPGTDAVYVDIAGDGEVRSAVHRTYGERLVYSMAVGATHWDQPSPSPAPEPLPGAPPAFFFAPDQVRKRADDWGQAGLDDRVATVWRQYLDFCDGWVDLQHGSGPDAVERVYVALLEGRTDPATGHILSMWPDRDV